MFDAHLTDYASALLERFRAQKLMLATAESCTGGLIAALFTEIPGSSDVFERGFVTYSNSAKADMLGVDPALIEDKGAVSPEVADAMARGALARSRADVSLSVTGIAGPGGGSNTKPVGLVYLAALHKGEPINPGACRFGDIGRSEVRLATVETALDLLDQLVMP